MAKDVFTINELATVSEFLNDLNQWLVEHEGFDDVQVIAALVSIVDGKGEPIGSFTKWSKRDDAQFEPNFIPDMVEV